MARRGSPTLWLAVCVLGALAGCRTFDPKHPAVGRPAIVRTQVGYSIWFDDGEWHVRFTPGEHPHRFQGSVAGVRGSVSELTPARPTLKDRIAMVGNAVQFDVDSANDNGSDGFEVRVLGSCASFDLLLDGKKSGEIAWIGPRRQPARRIPFEKCP